jgi:hypothetical protein
MALFGSNLTDILKDFTTLIDRLDNHAEIKAKEVVEHDEKILEYTEKRNLAGAEYDSAKKIALKVRDLINA